MRIRLGLGILLTMVATNARAEPSPHSFGLHLGGVATRPNELNTLVAQYKTALNLDATALGPAVRYGGFYDWRFDEFWSFGVGYSRMKVSTEGSSTNGALNLQAATQLFGLRAHYDAWTWGEVHLGFLLTGGVVLANTVTAINLFGTAQGIEASALGPQGSLAVTGAFFLAPQLSVEAEVGYQYARTGILKVKSDENTTFDAGDPYTSGNTSLRVNSSGLFMAFGIRYLLGAESGGGAEIPGIPGL